MKVGALGFLAGLALCPAPALAQTLPEAEAFVRGLYAAYDKGEPDYLGRGAADVFEPVLLGLVRKEAAEAEADGETGRLDWDPFCGCQDTVGLRLTSLTVEPAGPGKARAVAGLGARRVTLLFDAWKGRWWVEDVWSPDTPRLRDLLRYPCRGREGRHRATPPIPV